MVDALSRNTYAAELDLDERLEYDKRRVRNWLASVFSDAPMQIPWETEEDLTLIPETISDVRRDYEKERHMPQRVYVITKDETGLVGIDKILFNVVRELRYKHQVVFNGGTKKYRRELKRAISKKKKHLNTIKKRHPRLYKIIVETGTEC